MSKTNFNFNWTYGLKLAEKWVEDHAIQIQRAAVVGSVLRQEEECHDVDLLVIPKIGQTIMEAELPINLFITDRDSWETAVMQYAPAVGSTIGTRKKAKDMGYKLNQYGLFRKDDKYPISRSANKICQTIGATISRWVVASLSGEMNIWPKKETS